MDPTNRCEVCEKPALHKCGKCHNAHYCDKKHQREHWKQHKSVCQPFKICEDAVLGRHLVATRALKPGEVVIQEAPLIWGPSYNSIPVCLGCGKAVDETCSRPCQKCGWPVCSDLCEKSPSHIPECRYTSQRGEKITVKIFGVPHPIYKCITVLRCLYQKQFLPKNWKKLETLQNHLEEHKSTTNYESDRVTIAEFIRRFFKLSATFSEEDIMKVHGSTLVNGHEVPLTEPFHVAIYSSASMLEHSCGPNCTKSFTKQGHIVISAAKSIQEGDHLSICYSDPLWGTPSRRYFLHETKFFWCHCERCEDPSEFGTNFSAIKCSTKSCGGYLLPATFTELQKLPDWVCDKCDKTMSFYSVHDILERIGRDLFDLDKSSIEDCKDFLNTHQDLLHENHYYCTEVKYTLSQLIGQRLILVISDEDLSLKLQYCNSLEKLLKIIAPAEKRALGLILFEKYVALTEIARRAGPQKITDLEEAKKILLETIELLKNEPDVLPEGKICKQAVQKLKDIDTALQTLKSKEDVK
ncbi:SET domain-containing protein SmydA-8 [Tribolium castaneum]|uniref:Protein msta, isoform A-like Protein n=1 Tax=Tribolium castaneum TaxID=7070 RepID=A0A139WDX7_TRICA|nr:PREDICTED: protein msta, isoform B [Tribolium castaneum]KYB26114.1 Protein msta, isoform A-like Protein [Tribolium castaneum]|eukprot:XP_008196084.1 PREDICTED: protein msta, isoform B [Tribolium castaneum]